MRCVEIPKKCKYTWTTNTEKYALFHKNLERMN